MRNSTVSLLADEEVISAVASNIQVEGVRMDDPEPADALSDALDAPLGPDEVQALLQFLTVAFTSGTAALTFVKNVIELLKREGSNKEVKVVSVQSGAPIATIRSDSDAAEVLDKLKQ